MSEVMAKSKAFKAARQAQNDDDAEERDQLDAAYNALLQARPGSRDQDSAFNAPRAVQHLRLGEGQASQGRAGVQGGTLGRLLLPKGQKHDSQGPKDDGSAAYDRTRKDLVFSARGQVPACALARAALELPTAPWNFQRRSQPGVQCMCGWGPASAEAVMRAAASGQGVRLSSPQQLWRMPRGLSAGALPQLSRGLRQPKHATWNLALSAPVGPG